MTHIKSLVFQSHRGRASALLPARPVPKCVVRLPVCSPTRGSRLVSVRFLPFTRATQVPRTAARPPVPSIGTSEVRAHRGSPEAASPVSERRKLCRRAGPGGVHVPSLPPSHVALGDAARVSHPPTVEHKPVAPGMVPRGWLVLRADTGPWGQRMGQLPALPGWRCAPTNGLGVCPSVWVRVWCRGAVFVTGVERLTETRRGPPTPVPSVLWSCVAVCPGRPRL